MVTGKLEKDSPALYGELKARFDGEDLERLALAYTEAINAGAHKETDILRSEGASFNPRPARIATILIKVGNEGAAPTLMASMLACANEFWPLNLSDPLVPEKQIANDVIRYLMAPTAQPPFLVERISLAYCIDYVRHLHMSKLTKKDKEQVLNDIIGRVIEYHRSVENEVLKNLLVETLSKQQNKLEESAAAV